MCPRGRTRAHLFENNAELSANRMLRERPIVHLRIAAEHAEKLSSVPLDDQEEPAPVFTP